jgi:hypothetical protein
MEKTFIPLPNHKYDDGVVSFMTGPGFYGSGIAEMFGVEEAFATRCADAIKQLDAMVCHNPSCEKHKDVEVKYATENPEGIRVEETIAHMMDAIEPQNASELSVMLAVIFQDLLEDLQRKTARGGSGMLGELLGNLLRDKMQPQSNPEAEIQKLLASTSEGNSDYTAGGLQFNVESHEVWEAYGVPFERNIIIMGGVLKAFNIARDDPKMDGRHITKSVYDTVRVNNLQEQELRSMYIGKMMEKYENYRDNWEKLGADLDWRRYDTSTGKYS